MVKLLPVPDKSRLGAYLSGHWGSHKNSCQHAVLLQIAGGSGEWGISRDLYRLGTHLDYFRLMAFYHSAVSSLQRHVPRWGSAF